MRLSAGASMRGWSLMDGPPEDFRVLTIHADELPECQRFGVWCDTLSQKLLKVEGSAAGEQPYWANASLRILPGLRTGTGAFAPSIYRRPRKLAASDNDDFVLMINRGGRFAANQRNRDFELAPGDAYLMACAEPGSYSRSSAGLLTCLRFPARAVAPFVPDLYDRLATPIASDSQELKLILGYLRTMDGLPLAEESLRHLVVRHVHDLVTALLSPARAEEIEHGETGGIHAARFAAAETYIARQCVRPDLSLAEVAFNLRLSERQAQRLFEREGTTFSQFVLASRLERVRGLLGDPANAARNLSDIALASGFGDISHFIRAFRRRYGMPPSQYRRMKREG